MSLTDIIEQYVEKLPPSFQSEVLDYIRKSNGVDAVDPYGNHVGADGVRLQGAQYL
ncbi:MAG: hypothetical protein JW908_02985 [Anaerolineales bacterium]|nr:hypothetical protein [Anaerolineales bacterium]